jgi:hypothetical protein
VGEIRDLFCLSERCPCPGASVGNLACMRACKAQVGRPVSDDDAACSRDPDRRQACSGVKWGGRYSSVQRGHARCLMIGRVIQTCNHHCYCKINYSTDTEDKLVAVSRTDRKSSCTASSLFFKRKKRKTSLCQLTVVFTNGPEIISGYGRKRAS